MDLFNILLFIHIAGGSLSLLSGTYVLFIKKGDQFHQKLGRVFYYGLLVAGLAALPMSYLHSNYFLFIIAVFTLYMVLSGKRYLSIKSPENVSIYDWFISSLMLIFGLLFIVFGTMRLINGVFFGLVFLVFGMIALSFVVQDYTNFSGKSKIKNTWLTSHIQRMIGSYIASSTAFLVVNNTFLPPIIAWMLPTIILTPLIVLWSRKNEVFK